MRHAHTARRSLFYQTDASHTGIIPRKLPAHIVEESAVDLVDDLELPRDERLEQRHGPFLQRLRQQGVVRVGERTQRDVPCLVPPETRLIEENPHELRYGEGGVRVVHL